MSSTQDVEGGEGSPLVAEAAARRWSVARTLVGIAFAAGLVMTVIGVWSMRAAGAAQALPVIGLDVAAGEQADFYIFTHVGNPAMLPGLLEYPIGDLVNGEGHKGILVMYVMAKKQFAILLDYINKLAKSPDAPLPPELVELHNKTARKFMDEANAKIAGAMQRVRILTPFDFKGPLLSIRRRLGEESFHEWFGHTTYDAPKFADALLRLRAFGNDMPVFRFDVDVLFNKYTRHDISSITNAVAHGIADVDACVRDPWVQSFLVSQQYSAVKASRSREFDAWNEAYSTRANPALLATKNATDASQWKSDGGWGNFHPSPEALQQATDEGAMMAFYGLKKVDGEEMLQPTIPSTADSPAERAAEDILSLGNAYIGANPSRAVISGAALAAGPGVSVDMPPFLHTDLNIMWIDDHIFDRLTMEVMGTKRRPRPPGVGQARVVKARSQPFNLAKYTLEIYMPTLTYGILMDAWTSNHSAGYLLKYAPSDLPDTPVLTRAYAEILAKEAQGPWSRALQEVRTTGKMLSDAEVKDLKAAFWQVGGERVKDVYWQWSRLPQPTVDGEKTATFATLWGTGRTCEQENLKSYCTNPGFNKLGRGLVTPEWDAKAKGAASRAELPALGRDGFSPAMAEKIDQLMDAAVKHLRWTLTWPDVVQAIRNEMVGLVASDVAWHDAPPMPELGA